MEVLDLSLIISLKIESEDRLKNLETTLLYIQNTLDVEIILVEQDTKSKIELSDRVKYKHVFINTDEFFNRQRGVNLGVKYATKNVIFHYDLDVLFETAQIRKAYELICSGKYDVIYPYDGRFFDVPRQYHNGIKTSTTLSHINLEDCSLLHPQSVGGAVMFNKDVFIMGGGTNENFKGLGYEDNELFDRFLKLDYKVGRVRGPLYHLTHSRHDTSFDKNPYGNSNMVEYKRITSMPKNQLLLEVSKWNNFNKIVANISDNVFSSHQVYASPFVNSNTVLWNKDLGGVMDDESIIYTDGNILNVRLTTTNNVAWLCEPREYHSTYYDWIEKNHNKFREVWTHDSKLLGMGDKFKLVPWGGTWLRTLDQKVYPKTKMCSIIASGKRQLEGHVFRHEVIKNISNVDVFGYGYNPVENKISALSDYRFSICIENTKSDWYFTEKIIDCFRTGTVPIYWGCKNIDQFFDPRGIITFNTIEELNRILDTLTPESYIEKYDYVLSNFKTSSEFTSIEDWLVSNKFIQ